MINFEYKTQFKNMTIAIYSSMKFDQNSILGHIFHFWDKLGQNWPKITQSRSRNKKFVLLSQNILLQGKHTKNLEF